MDVLINRVLIFHKIHGFILVNSLPENEKFVLRNYGRIEEIKNLIEKGVEIFNLFSYAEGQGYSERKLTFDVDILYLQMRLDDIIKNSPEQLDGKYDLSEEVLKQALKIYRPV